MIGNSTHSLEAALRDIAQAPVRTASREALATIGIGDLVQNLGIAAFSWDMKSDAMSWSANVASVLGLSRGDVPASGRALQRLLTEATATARLAAIPPISGNPGQDLEPKPYRAVYALRGGERRAERWVEEIGLWRLDSSGSPILTEGLVRVVPAASSAAESHLVNGNTGLLLRDSLLKRLSETIETLKQDRQGSAVFVTIAVDGLSAINATFGYETGDHIIRTVADRIARRMRGGDVIGHMSGHKFGAILHNCTEQMLTFVVDRFRQAIGEEMVAIDETEIAVHVSMGAVLVPRNASDAETAAIRAEEALATARADGAGGFALYQLSPERDSERRHNLQTARDIVRGLREGRFVLAYQPVVCANTGVTLYREALSRYVRPDGHVVSAGSLIATAEQLGLVRNIDLRALYLALCDLSENADLRLSVNASVETILDPVWLGRLMDAVTEDRAIGPRLTVEITETSAMRDIATMRRVAGTLRDIGCKVALDDFGAGHSSLRSLRDLEIDWLKIDGSYVEDIATNPDSRTFVETLVRLAGHFGIRTVAEWVQDETGARILQELGVDALQGRHVGVPRLRLSPLTEGVIGDGSTLAVEATADGYPSFGTILTGPLADFSKPAA